MKFSIQSFKGVAPRVNPRYLPDGMAQVCRNAEAIGWSLKPMPSAEPSGDSVDSLAETIYLYNAQGDTPLWLDWQDDVDIAKAQIANDSEEWTHFTGDSRKARPHSTYASIAYSGGSTTLGVLPPENKPPVALSGNRPDASTGEVPDARVYVTTFVRKVAGLTAESMPSPASDVLEVYDSTQTVDLDLPALPTGSSATHIRLYRSTGGDYLYVDEYPISSAGTTVNDSADADSLNEIIPSLDWAPPPEGLSGLTNMPNGVVAGFVGRDVFFCEPYRPYAWPVKYMQSLDYDIVGLGVIDTTLVVATTGEPYLIQGATPDSMVVVKGEAPQACVSKRSIVSAQGSVFYASPDGLVRMSSNSTELLTWEKFDPADWKALNPESFRATFHEDKYIAFYDGENEAGALVMDLRTGEVSFSDQFAEAMHRDLFTDTLYIKPAGSGSLLKWRSDDTKQTAVWRSKLYTMPYTTCFSCAQVEAEGYPLTLRLYANGDLLHEQAVQSRDAFRLPAKPARDWEFELETQHEVFAVSIAQSMQELASG